jgi:glycosyltransferase involved in cell wall biosynthesis
MPEVSVIIPNYNHARFLKKRIDSVIRQTFKNIEIIILDDFSTDESRKIINQYVAIDSRIKTIFNSKNSGSPFAQWNKGIKEASSEYIWIAESDDFSDLSFLERSVNIFNLHSSVGLVFTQSYNVNAEDEVIEVNRELGIKSTFDPEKNFLEKGENVILSTGLLESIIPNASAVVFRKNIFEKTGGVSAEYKMIGDWLIWLKMMMETDVYYMAQPLNYFRSHSGTTRSDQMRNLKRFSLRYTETYNLYRDFFKLYPKEIKLKNKIFSYLYSKWYWRFKLSSILDENFIQIVKAAFRADPYFCFRLFSFFMNNFKNFFRSFIAKKS